MVILILVFMCLWGVVGAAQQEVAVAPSSVSAASSVATLTRSIQDMAREITRQVEAKKAAKIAQEKRMSEKEAILGNKIATLDTLAERVDALYTGKLKVLNEKLSMLREALAGPAK